MTKYKVPYASAYCLLESDQRKANRRGKHVRYDHRLIPTASSDFEESTWTMLKASERRSLSRSTSWTFSRSLSPPQKPFSTRVGSDVVQNGTSWSALRSYPPSSKVQGLYSATLPSQGLCCRDGRILLCCLVYSFFRNFQFLSLTGRRVNYEIFSVFTMRRQGNSSDDGTSRGKSLGAQSCDTKEPTWNRKCFCYKAIFLCGACEKMWKWKEERQNAKD